MTNSNLIFAGIWVLVKDILLVSKKDNKVSLWDIISLSFFTYLFIWSATYGLEVAMKSISAVLNINAKLPQFVQLIIPLMVDVFSTHISARIKLRKDVKNTPIYFELVRGFIFSLFLFAICSFIAIVFWLKLLLNQFII